MASSFKIIDPKDIVSTRNLLHEAIPITASILSGTYGTSNIKTYSHGMFQSVYDYPYLSSSANHILDLTAGYANSSRLSGTTDRVQQAKKINIYNEMAQVLAGFDQDGVLRAFDQDGDLTGGTKSTDCIFINLARLLSKDEIKKGSFSLELGTGTTYAAPFNTRITLTDASGSNGFKVNSPAGEYGILFAKDSKGTPIAGAAGQARAGLVYYQAGIAVVSASVLLPSSAGGILTSAAVFLDHTTTPGTAGIASALTGSTINTVCDSFRHRIHNLQFNNTTELNSTIYFARVNHNDFNYSANPTYLSASKMVVKNNSTDSPVSYATAVGLYSADNELLAVAKLSEPLRKDPSTEFTLRVRLDY